MPPCPRAAPGSGEGSAGTSGPKVVDIFRDHADAYRARHGLSPEQDRFLRDVTACRTAALGGHLYVCPGCGFEEPHYNSCRNRNCPNCQALEQARWIEARERRILPVGHHHVVFTLPEQVRPLARRYPKEVYEALFAAVNDALTTLAHDVLGAQLGVTAVLHTWTRKLLFHPHVHCIVTAGGLSTDGQRWVERTRYLFPVRRMKALFRARFLAQLARRRDAGRLPCSDEEWSRLLRDLPGKRSWVIFVEPPFGRSTHVLRYLGRYTHRVAISDQRLVAVDHDHVTFRTYDDETLTLSPEEFIRRFLLHVLPRGFRKIRHFGMYSPAGVRSRLPRARDLLGDGDRPDDPTEPSAAPHESWAEVMARLVGADPLLCPRCRSARLVPRPLARGPPPRPG